MKDCEICAVELTPTDIRNGVCSNCGIGVSLICLSYKEALFLLKRLVEIYGLDTHVWQVENAKKYLEANNASNTDNS